MSINFSGLVFEVKTHICEQLPSENIAEDKCIVEWKLATPDTWNVSEIKDTLHKFSCLLKQWFEIEFVYIGSLVIRTIVPEHILSNYDDFKSAVRSFLAKIVEVCQLETDTPTVVKVDLNIFTEIPPNKMVEPPNNELRTVLRGKTGSGKSKTANTIIGQKAFKICTYVTWTDLGDI